MLWQSEGVAARRDLFRLFLAEKRDPLPFYEELATRTFADFPFPITGRRILDLGCGPGNSTQLLVERFPEAEVIGVDSSPDMLRQARGRLPGCEFVQADLTDWSAPQDADILYSNATFQWVPDHLSVLMTEKDAVKCAASARPDWWVLQLVVEPDDAFIAWMQTRLEALRLPSANK